MPYLSYCAEIWGNAGKTCIDSLFKLQKRAIRIVDKVGYCEPTNALFIKYKTLKLMDIINMKTLEIVFRVKNNNIPNSIKNFFKLRERDYHLRGLFIFENVKVRTNVKSRCISVMGVKLWNGLKDEFKQCAFLVRFKKMYKSKILSDYHSL